MNLQKAFNRLLENPSFKAWFGKGVVREPVFHGTLQPDEWLSRRSWTTPEEPPGQMFRGRHLLSGFAPDRHLMHVGTAEAAEQAAALHAGADVPLGKRRMTLMPLVINIKRPLRLFDDGDDPIDTFIYNIQNPTNTVQADDQAVRSKLVMDYLKKYAASFVDDGAGDIMQKQLPPLPRHTGSPVADFYYVQRDSLPEFLTQRGYDSLSYINNAEDKGKLSYVTISPYQVKSIFNRGTFDPKDPNIGHSDGGLVRGALSRAA